MYVNDFSMYRFFDRSRENLSRGGARDFGRDSLGLRDGSEMVVSDACVKGKEKLNVAVNFMFVLACAFFCFSFAYSLYPNHA